MKKIPKLRFKEFSNDWEEKKLGDIILQLKAGVSVNSNEQEKVINSTKAILKTSCIYKGKFIENEAKKILPEELKKVGLYAKKGQLIISRMNTPQLVGAVAYIEKDFTNRYLPDRIWQTEFKNKKYNGKFLSYLLNTSKYNLKIRDLATGTSNSMKNISKENFLNLNIFISRENEQQKIVEFLSSVDKKINLIEVKLELFKKYKRGVMQNLFSQELKFKDNEGNDYPGWKEKKLGDIFIEISERNLTEEKLELLSVSINNGVQKRNEIEAKDNSSEDKRKYKKVDRNDIVYNTMRMWQGAVGVSNYVGIVSPAYTVIRLKTQDNINYFKYLFKTYIMIYIFKKFSQGLTSDTWNLKFEKFKEIKIWIPISLEEQQKIVDFLVSIDIKIENIEKELEGLKEFKKGLLQQMFV
ncbi:restriction endonuclease subunit S [Fusobacterium ulcerans]|uniref:restriction endonuclease subunit S n=1 Tax=Fusobacterium ulcerans TaxID=861 RepID=UPI002E7A2DEA|nr:restriction endonuclease subunit S [Fusobacterium ulcerans]MEE0137632.1 restriction endonuclease subunit S [Fusobacterium ulcerans]